MAKKRNDYYKINLDLLNEFHVGMFEYTGLPDTLRTNYMEYWLQKYGKVAIFRIPEGRACDGFPVGSLICSSCSLGRELDPYGEGAEVIAVTRNGYSVTLNRYNDDMVLGFNNLTELGCTDVKADALRLSEIDVSIDYLIFWSRVVNLFKVADEKTKKDIISAFEAMEKGKPIAITTKQILKDLGISTDGIEIEALTAPELADKIQYTARLREDVLRWHYTRYGQVIQGDTKLAQQSVDEVNGTVSSSLIIPLNMLKARRAMIEEINKKFGLNATVDLSGPWRAEVTKYENETGEGEIDEDSEGDETEPEETPVTESDEKEEEEKDNEEVKENERD